MANRLFDAPDLVEVEYGDGMWSAQGFDLQATRAAATLYVQDPCAESGQFVAGAKDASQPKVYHITAFSATVSARRNNRCADGEELGIVSDLLTQDGIVGSAEFALWYGISAWDPNLQPSLQNNDIQSISAQTQIQDTVALAIIKYATLTVVDDYVVHLGVQAALDLSAQGYTETIDQAGQLRVKATGAPIVVSPYYPAMGVAVTGPILIKVGDPAAFQTWERAINRTNIVGYQLIAVAFDPSTAVRAV